MPSSTMWSNSCLAMSRHSGGSQRGQACTGGPVLAMWCKAERFTGVSFGTGEVSEGNSWSRAVNCSSPTGQGKLGLGSDFRGQHTVDLEVGNGVTETFLAHVHE